LQNGSEWDRSLYGIAVKYNEKAVHIRIEPVLQTFLKAPDRGALRLARDILAVYREKFGVPLAIDVDSLAIEILGHVYIDVILAAMERLRLGARYQTLVARIKKSTAVIDCGEADVDNNRFLWDGLAPFAEVIYGILGDRA